VLRPLFALLVATAAISALPTDGHAQPRKVAVLGVEIGGDGAPELRPQLAASIAAGLADAKVRVVQMDAVSSVLDGAPELAGCMSSTCLERLGRKTGADGFIRARVKAEGDDYKLELELYDRSQLLNKLELPCSVCTIGELNQAAKLATAKLLTEAPEQPVQVVIRSAPSGATLTIDGIARGTEPFEGPLAPGRHAVIAEVEGGGRVERELVITEASGTEPIVIELGGDRGASREPGDTVVINKGSKLGTIKWITAAGAVAALGTGATLIILDGRGTCGDSGRECERELNTGLAGVITAGGGVVMAVAAAWMFWADRDRGETDRRQVSFAPTRSGGMAWVTGRF
jgi:hypothetical protein